MVRLASLVLALCAVAVVGQESSSCSPAAKAIVTSDVIDRAKDAGITWGIAFLNTLSFSEDDYILNVLSLRVKNLRNIVILDGYTLDIELSESSSGGMGGNIAANLLAEVSAEVDLQLLGFCHTTVSFRLKGVSASGRGSFDLTSGSNLTIGLIDLDATLQEIYHLRGGCSLPTIINILSDLGLNFLNGILRGVIKDQIRGLNSVVEDLVNTALAQFSWQMPVPLPAPLDKALFDFHLCDLQVRGSGSEARLDVGVKGEFRDAGNPTLAPPLARPALQEVQPAMGYDGSLVLGNYTVDTLLYTYFQQGALAYSLDRSQMPVGALQDFLSTDFFAIMLPTLSRQYPHANMTLALNVSSQPKARISESHLQAQADLDFAFLVDQPGADPVPAFTLTCNVILAGSVWVNRTNDNPVTVAGKLDSVSGCAMEVKEVDCRGCKPGLRLLSSVARQANIIFQQVLLPKLNAVLQMGVDIPVISIHNSDLGKVINISFSTGMIDVETDYALVAVDAAAIVSDYPHDRVHSNGFSPDSSPDTPRHTLIV